MSGSRDEASEFERLRSLLLSPEASRLAAAEAHIRDLTAWVGDAPGLEAATAQILIEALKRAEIARHRELAAAIAPVVVAAIRGEIHNSRDMMVEALYPITGRLVAAAVSNAFRDMLEAINQRLEALVSTNRWRIRLRALATGRPVAEIALAEARDGFSRILLLERGSGRLLAQWRPGGLGKDNPDLIGGMIAAISEFAATALSDQHGELRKLDLGASQIYLSASSRIILAAETAGEVSAKRRKRLDAGFIDLVIRHDRGETLGEADLAALAQAPARRAIEGDRVSRWAMLLLIVGIGLALRVPLHVWVQGAAIDSAFRRAVAADPRLANYPLTLREDWSEGIVTLNGLAASAASVDSVLAAVGPAAAPMKVVSEVEIVSTAADLRATREAGERAVAGQADLEARVVAQLGALSDLRGTTAGEAETSAARLERQVADATAARAKIERDLERLDQRLDVIAAAATEAARRADSARDAIAALATLPAKVAALEVAGAELRAKTAGQGDAIATLGTRSQVDRAAAEARARTARADIDKVLMGLDRKIGGLVSASTNAAKQVDALRGGIADLADLPAKVAELSAAASDLRAKIAAQREALAGIEHKVGELGSVANGNAERVDELRGEIVALAGLPAKVAGQGDALAALGRQGRADSIADEDRDSALRAQIETLLAGLEDKTRENAAASTAAVRRVEALKGEVAAIQAAFADPRHVLADAASRAILLFGDRDNLTDPAAADKTLDALADAIRRTGLGLRVIGYADESGSVAGNLEYSKARAAKAAKLLIDRGVAADKLVLVGRSAQSPIADVSDPRARNRRVVFEPLYPEEPAP